MSLKKAASATGRSGHQTQHITDSCTFSPKVPSLSSINPLSSICVYLHDPQGIDIHTMYRWLKYKIKTLLCDLSQWKQVCMPLKNRCFLLPNLGVQTRNHVGPEWPWPLPLRRKTYYVQLQKQSMDHVEHCLNTKKNIPRRIMGLRAFACSSRSVPALKKWTGFGWSYRTLIHTYFRLDLRDLI